MWLLWKSMPAVLASMSHPYLKVCVRSIFAMRRGSRAICMPLLLAANAAAAKPMNGLGCLGVGEASLASLEEVVASTKTYDLSSFRTVIRSVPEVLVWEKEKMDMGNEMADIAVSLILENITRGTSVPHSEPRGPLAQS